MTPLQLFFFAVLPLTIGVVGVFFGEIFRARQVGEISRIRQREAMHAKENQAAMDRFSNVFTTVTPLEHEVLLRILARQREIVTNYGNTLIATLRRLYGPDFARGIDANERLSDALQRLDFTSQNNLVRDYESGKLSEMLKRSN
jgi:hypothetical protein